TGGWLMGNGSDRDLPAAFNPLSIDRWCDLQSKATGTHVRKRAGWLFLGVIPLLFIVLLINDERSNNFYFTSTTSNIDTSLKAHIDASRQTCFDRSATIDDRINSCTIAINANENDPAVHLERGLLNGRKREFDRAVADFAAALQWDKQYLPALLG